MKMVYQIGQVPLYGSLVNAIELSEDRKWIVKETPFQQVSGWFNHTPYGRRLFERVDVSIKGTLTSNGNQQFMHLMSRLKARGGLREVPLIVFELQGLEKNPYIRWLYTTGTISNIDDQSSYGETEEGFLLKEFTVTMKIDPVWRPLLRWYWEDRPTFSAVQSPAAQNGTDTLFAQPMRFQEIGQENYFQQWGDDYSALAPEMWPYLYQRGNGYGTDYAAFRSFFVNSVEYIWAAPPLSFYAFKNLLGQGTLRIKVENSETTQWSTLDLGLLNTQLINRGQMGLLPADELFAGATDPFCCWIRRNGVTLANFVPQWNYEGAYPGELMAGLNRVTIDGYNTTGSFAANIMFGAL